MAEMRYFSIICAKYFVSNSKVFSADYTELKVLASFTVATHLTVLLAAKERALYDLEYPLSPVYRSIEAE